MCVAGILHGFFSYSAWHVKYEFITRIYARVRGRLITIRRILCIRLHKLCAR